MPLDTKKEKWIEKKSTFFFFILMQHLELISISYPLNLKCSIKYTRTYNPN